MIVDAAAVAAAILDHPRGPNAAGFAGIVSASCMCGWQGGALKPSQLLPAEELAALAGQYALHLAEQILARRRQPSPQAVAVTIQALLSPQVAPPAGALCSASFAVPLDQWRAARAAVPTGLGPVQHMLSGGLGVVLAEMRQVLNGDSSE